MGFESLFKGRSKAAPEAETEPKQEQETFASVAEKAQILLEEYKELEADQSPESLEKRIALKEQLLAIRIKLLELKTNEVESAAEEAHAPAESNETVIIGGREIPAPIRIPGMSSPVETSEEATSTVPMSQEQFSSKWNKIGGLYENVKQCIDKASFAALAVANGFILTGLVETTPYSDAPENIGGVAVASLPEFYLGQTDQITAKLMDYGLVAGSVAAGVFVAGHLINKGIETLRRNNLVTTSARESLAQRGLDLNGRPLAHG